MGRLGEVKGRINIRNTIYRTVILVYEGDYIYGQPKEKKRLFCRDNATEIKEMEEDDKEKK